MNTPEPLYTAGERRVVHIVPGVEMAFHYIPRPPGGAFRMGSRDGPVDWLNTAAQPVHRVRIPHGFWLGETPVTQAQFAAWTQVAGVDHRNHFEGRPDHPAESMDWWQAMVFCRWLSAIPETKFPARRLMACLPTEAEWEWACGGQRGAETEYWSGDGEAALAEVGWYAGNAGGSTRAVAQQPANEFGLHDLHGNVWEWCHDIWDETAYRWRVDGAIDLTWRVRAKDFRPGEVGWREDDQHRVIRGGSCDFTPWGCRSAYHNWRTPGDGYRDQGFRVCLAPGPAELQQQSTETEKAEAKPGEGDGGRGTSPESDAPGAAGAGGADRHVARKKIST